MVLYKKYKKQDRASSELFLFKTYSYIRQFDVSPSRSKIKQKFLLTLRIYARKMYISARHMKISQKKSPIYYEKNKKIFRGTPVKLGLFS